MSSLTEAAFYRIEVDKDLKYIIAVAECRSSGGMELTEAGEVYVSYAKKILALRRNVEREMQQLLSKKG